MIKSKPKRKMPRLMIKNKPKRTMPRPMTKSKPKKKMLKLMIKNKPKRKRLMKTTKPKPTRRNKPKPMNKSSKNPRKANSKRRKKASLKKERKAKVPRMTKIARTVNNASKKNQLDQLTTLRLLAVSMKVTQLHSMKKTIPNGIVLICQHTPATSSPKVVFSISSSSRIWIKIGTPPELTRNLPPPSTSTFVIILTLVLAVETKKIPSHIELMLTETARCSPLIHLKPRSLRKSPELAPVTPIPSNVELEL